MSRDVLYIVPELSNVHGWTVNDYLNEKHKYIIQESMDHGTG